MAKEEKYVKLTGKIERETNLAILFIRDNDDEVWVPKSQIDFEHFNHGKGEIWIKEWIAKKNDWM